MFIWDWLPCIGYGDSEEFVEGSQDRPGYAVLPKMNHLLCVGNQYSAACSKFDCVISTVIPKDLDGENAPNLSTHQLMFEDGHGHESANSAAFAREQILQGAALTAKALSEGKRTLVHCEWGQNRSNSICCAYAVLYLKWSAKDAIDYAREQNWTERCYAGQRPMFNEVFNQLIQEFEDSPPLDEISSLIKAKTQQVAPVNNTIGQSAHLTANAAPSVAMSVRPDFKAVTVPVGSSNGKWKALVIKPGDKVWARSAQVEQQ
eukprot:TRINITY_DN48750_c0_g1_i1.p1 TRINITY_DN48750_c0_g1~~TRINITY_DN48750_c0_g1_i1.p1  ORF type:complete len:294 (-),score=44.48 TRINITY_DN48750_c0_g1_i1:122-904(-)